MTVPPVLRGAVVGGLLLALFGFAPSVQAANLLAGPKMPAERQGVKKQKKAQAIKKGVSKERIYQQWEMSIGDWVTGMERPMSVPEIKGLDRADPAFGK
ncbi:MAG: hypothetical protein ACREJU_12325 [Nitrospiraceae bacterium]